MALSVLPTNCKSQRVHASLFAAGLQAMSMGLDAFSGFSERQLPEMRYRIAYLRNMIGAEMAPFDAEELLGLQVNVGNEPRVTFHKRWAAAWERQQADAERSAS